MIDPFTHLIIANLICLLGFFLGLHVFIDPKWHQDLNFLIRAFPVPYLRFWGLFSAIVSIAFWFYFVIEKFLR